MKTVGVVSYVIIVWKLLDTQFYPAICSSNCDANHLICHTFVYALHCISMINTISIKR